MIIYKKPSWLLYTIYSLCLFIVPMLVTSFIYINVVPKIVLKDHLDDFPLFYSKYAIIIVIPLILMITGFIILKLTEYNFLILCEDKIKIKGIFFPFLNRTYNYNEIESCILGNLGGYTPDYLQIKNNGKWGWKWKISLVDKSYYPEIIQTLNNNNIEVLKKNIK